MYLSIYLSIYLADDHEMTGTRRGEGPPAGILDMRISIYLSI